MIRYLEPTQPAGQQAVQAAEATLGVRLPQQYRAYLLNHAKILIKIDYDLNIFSLNFMS